MYPVPSVASLATYSGRPQTSYTGFAVSALLQAAITFSFRTEITDPSQLSGYNNLTAADQAVLATNGICSYADYLYLRQPYQQMIATPAQSEVIGSYSYTKPYAEIARNAAALEVTGEAIGVPMFDLAVQLLSLRTLAGGVYFGSLSVFEHPRGRDDRVQLRIKVDRKTGQHYLAGPSDMNQIELQMFDINAEMFGPIDPGIG
jgi:hypothetical protein